MSALLGVGLVITPVGPSVAAGTGTRLDIENQFISVGTAFGVYVPEGGTLDLDLHIFAHRDTDRSVPSLRIIVTSPSGERTEFNPEITPQVVKKQWFRKANLSDTSAGVWSIAAFGGSPLAQIPTIDADARVPSRRVYYGPESAITPRDASGAALDGHVWAEVLTGWNDSKEYGKFKNAPAVAGSDRTLYHLSRLGVLYQSIEHGFDGIYSSLLTDNYGVVGAGTCARTYKSSILTKPPRASAACPGFVQYRIFLEPPSADLPTQTAKWFDGRTEDTWVRPIYAPTSLESVRYAPDGARLAASQWGGVFTAEATGMEGNLVTEIDTNGNGVYTDAVDTRLESIGVPGGTLKVTWDGKNGKGEQLSLNAPVRARLSWDMAAEIHILSMDIEARTEGIEIKMLEGPRPGDQIVRWDDSEVAADLAGVAVVGVRPDPISTGGPSENGVDSAGGVHRWGEYIVSANKVAPIPGSWADHSMIDDYNIFVEHSEIELALDAAIAISKASSHDAAAGALAPGDVVTHTVEMRNSGSLDLPGQTVVDDVSDVLTRGDVVVDSLQASSGAAVFDAKAKAIRWTGDLGRAGVTEDPDVPDTVTVSYRVSVKATEGIVTDGEVVDNACVEGRVGDDGAAFCDSVRDPVDFPAWGLDLTKVGRNLDGSVTTGLEGAGFELRVDDGGAPGDMATRTVVNDVAHTTSAQDVTIDAVVDTPGLYRARAVPPGTYWLVEVQPPPPYALAANPVCLRATADRVDGVWAQRLTLCEGSDTLVSTPQVVVDGSDGSDAQFALTFTNNHPLTMPRTGGSDGTRLVSLAAGSLAIAVMGVSIWRRRRPTVMSRGDQ
ncbi:SpaA isopeptide-forming pilin-related protein [Xylanimonas ulmi]|uniref:DUF7927 domain-containing protein n=1 Tax=Xylanimonas ulmi TaxID=228973 RepID=A0A4Q7LXP5_9MICO|nr:SpaA isopeptide-forming pilin-related protein [Xylanibacterium ulmi]RZS59786.1 hypothetical protein EV386_0022 [Xylanibacterium ulmi]